VQRLGVATLTRGDCLILICASGQSAHLSHLAQLAKKAGATIISVTNQSANPLAALADIRLYSVSYGSDSDMPNIVATTSQQHVIDLVFYNVAQPDERGEDLLARDLGPADLSEVR
jgi:RpiR family transcriptional regulator, carbohydrate utilization regulator